jgi:hypothetical protein
LIPLEEPPLVVEDEDIQVVEIFEIGIGIFEIGIEIAIVTFEMFVMVPLRSAVILIAIGVAATGISTQEIHGSALVAVAPALHHLLVTSAT